MQTRPLALVLALLAAGAAAQTPADGAPAVPADSSIVEVVLDDGSRFTGVVVSETAEALLLETSGGARVTVPKDRIRRRRAFAGRMVGGRLLRDDPNRSRLLFAPTARPVGRGNGYVAVYEVLFPFAAVGAGEAVSLAGGISLFPTTEVQILYVAPKVTVAQGARSSVAVGVFGAAPIGTAVDEAVGFGLGYGVATLGTPQGAATVGVGYGRAFGVGEGDDAGGLGVGLVGGELQVSNSVKLLTENYVLLYPAGDGFDCTRPGPCRRIDGGTDATVLVSGGVRFFGENLAADLALFVVPEIVDEGVPFLPWVGFAYNF